MTSGKPHYENVPFEMPETWEWVTLPELCAIPITDGTHQTPTYTDKDNGVPFLSSKDVTSGRINWTETKYITKDLHEVLHKRIAPKPDDILLAKNGTTGVAARVDCSMDFDIYVTLAVIRPVKYINSKYLWYIINSPFCKEQFNSHLTGIGLPNLHLRDINKTSIPIPPQLEQKRIVEELDKWFAFIDNLESNKQDLQKNIKLIKSEILKLAITGRLVSQDIHDEPAIEVLRRINPSYNSCDTSHYPNLPQGWTVCKIQDIADIISGVSYNKADITQNGIRIIRGGNIQDGKIVDCLDDVYIDVKYKNESNTIHIGDIVMVASTGSQTLIGKTGYANKEYPNTQIGAFLRIIRAKEAQLAKFLDYIFCSEDFKMHIRKLASGTNINNIKNNYVLDYEISIPPLAEIHRIISKVDNVFSIIHSITKDLL